MSATTYRVGKIAIAASVMKYVSDATLAVNFATEEDTGIGQDWATHQALGRSWSLSGTAKHDPADTAQLLVISEFLAGDGKLTSVYMYYNATNYFYGSCLVASAGVRKSVGAQDVFTFAFTGNGAVARG